MVISSLVVSPLRAHSPPEEHRSLPDITASIGILHLLHVKIYLPNSHMVVSSGVSLSEAMARQPGTLALQLTVVVTDTPGSLDVSSCLHRILPTCLASLSAVICTVIPIGDVFGESYSVFPHTQGPSMM
jgi:hypothetical protein